MIYRILLYGASLVIILSCSQGNGSEQSKKIDTKKEVLPPCKACKTLVKSFLKGMTDTNRNHFGGGDTAWEEEKLGDYAKSEVRLIEIQESLCSDVHKGQLQCYSLAEEWEPLIEDWWFREQQNNSDFFKWLCIQKSQFCCPENHFGPECKPCDGYPDSVCFNNGKCKGAGTREGNGECICHPGYIGSKCNKCAHLYFESYRDNEKLLCTKCHKACKDSCSSSGPQGCKDCNAGWFSDSAGGCLDINECSTNDPCSENEFCLNNEGSYACIACHHSCNGCYGDGPGMCTKCAKGFTFKEGYCTVMDQESSRKWPRYYTYIGLCIATCIIFQKNTVFASLFGLSVAIYVTMSEYMIYNNENQSQKPFQ